MKLRHPAAVVAVAAAGSLLLPAPAQASGALTFNAPKKISVPEKGCTKVKGSVKVKTRPGAKVVFKATGSANVFNQRFDAPTIRLDAKRDRNRDGVVKLGGKQRVCASDLRTPEAAPFLDLLRGQTVRAKITIIAQEKRPGKDKVSRESKRVKVVF